MTSQPADTDPVYAIGEGLLRIIRLHHRAVRQRAELAPNDTERSTARILGVLIRSGPKRLTALAVETDSDLSTISRQVAELVRRGLLERRADPADRRASLLVPTERGCELNRQHLKHRSEHLNRVLREWSAGDREQLARLLIRFTDELSEHGDPFSTVTANPRPLTVHSSTRTPTDD